MATHCVILAPDDVASRSVDAVGFAEPHGYVNVAGTRFVSTDPVQLALIGEQFLAASRDLEVAQVDRRAA